MHLGKSAFVHTKCNCTTDQKWVHSLYSQAGGYPGPAQNSSFRLPSWASFLSYYKTCLQAAEKEPLDDIRHKGRRELRGEPVAHCYFWLLSECSTGTHPHTTSAPVLASCSGGVLPCCGPFELVNCPVLGHP